MDLIETLDLAPLADENAACRLHLSTEEVTDLCTALSGQSTLPSPREEIGKSGLQKFGNTIASAKLGELSYLINMLDCSPVKTSYNRNAAEYQIVNDVKRPIESLEGGFNEYNGTDSTTSLVESNTQDTYRDQSANSASNAVISARSSLQTKRVSTLSFVKCFERTRACSMSLHAINKRINNPTKTRIIPNPSPSKSKEPEMTYELITTKMKHEIFKNQPEQFSPNQMFHSAKKERFGYDAAKRRRKVMISPFKKNDTMRKRARIVSPRVLRTNSPNLHGEPFSSTTKRNYQNTAKYLANEK